MTSSMSRVVFCMEGILRSRSLKSTVLVVGAIAGGLAFAGTKALASEYNPSQPQEPVQAGQVMADTTYEYFELIGEKNNGFEQADNDWVAKQVNEAPYNIASNHFHKTDIRPAFKEDYCARLKASNKDAFKPAVQIEIDLSSEDTLKLGELDSLIIPILQYQYDASKSLDVTIDLIEEEEGEVLDTLTYNYGGEIEISEHRIIIANLEKPPYKQWLKQVFNEDLIKAIKENNLENHYIKSLRIYVEIKEGGDQVNEILLDEVYLHATRQIITGAEETPTGRTPELSDVILNPSNLYQATFPERGTLTIYEASTGRRVQAPIEVYGHVDVDLSKFPAGVYFGVYKPQEGRHQVGKIIKTQ